MIGFDSNEFRLQDLQRPDMYRAGVTLRSTFEPDETMGSDLTSLMIQLAHLPASAKSSDTI